MAGLFLLVVIAVLIAVVIYKLYVHGLRTNPDKWAAFIKKNNASVEDQRRLIEKLHLPYSPVPLDGSAINFGVSYSFDDDFSNESNVSPMPWADRKVFTDSDGDKYFVAWVGKGPITSFGLNRKARVTMRPTKILKSFSGRMYIAGIEEGSSSETLYKYQDISSQIKSVGHAPGNLLDWATRVLSLDVGVLDSLTVNDDCETLEQIWSGNGPATSFTYRTDNRERVTITPTRLLKSRLDDYIYLVGEVDGEERTFKPKQIETLVQSEGYKKFKFDEWINQVLIAHQEVTQ